MSASIMSLDAWREKREDESFERQARALGYPNFAALEAEACAAFDAALEHAQDVCARTHSGAEKNPHAGMCEDCANAFVWPPEPEPPPARRRKRKAA